MWRLTALACFILIMMPSMAAADSGAVDDFCPDSNLTCRPVGPDIGPGFDVNYGVAGIYGLPPLKAPDDAGDRPSTIYFHSTGADDDRPVDAAGDNAIKSHAPTDDTPIVVSRDETTGGFVDEGGERVLRIHEDNGDADAPPQVDDGQAQLELSDDEGANDINGEAGDIRSFQTAYMDWMFIPVIQVTDVDGAVSDVDAQRALETDEEHIAACFEPTGYRADGAVVVDLHLSYNGIVQAVNGHTDALQPRQARCILERAWSYEFPRLASVADEPSHLQYRVDFVGQPTETPTVDADEPVLMLERLRTSEPELDDRIAEAMVDNLSETQFCAAAGLDELPEELVVTEVHGQWQRSEGNRYSPSQLDITVHNKTSSQMPSSEVVSCYETALRQWDFELEADEMPDDLSASMFVTTRPAGWEGM